MDLMQIMMSKIKATETKCAFLERTNREKDKKISILEEKLEIYKKSNLNFFYIFTYLKIKKKN